MKFTTIVSAAMEIFVDGGMTLVHARRTSTAIRYRRSATARTSSSAAADW